MFCPLGHLVLVGTVNTTVVAYVKQGELWSHHMHTLLHKLIGWSSTPVMLNSGGGFIVHGAILAILETGNSTATWWLWVGRAEITVLASGENAQCPLFYTLHDPNTPLGVDALVHE